MGGRGGRALGLGGGALFEELLNGSGDAGNAARASSSSTVLLSASESTLRMLGDRGGGGGRDGPGRDADGFDRIGDLAGAPSCELTARGIAGHRIAPPVSSAPTRILPSTRGRSTSA